MRPLGDRILAALATSAGRTSDALAGLCGVQKVELASVLNQLAQQNKIQFANGGDGKVLVVLASVEEIASKNALAELSNNERHVHQTIAEKGRDGIWKRDIKHRTGLVEKEVEKILKSLQKKKLVKMEKTVLRQNGKMFFLFDVEPSVEHSGGAWYSRPNPQDPPEFDAAGVNVISDACHRFVKDDNQVRTTYLQGIGEEPRDASLEDIYGWVAKLELYKEALNREHVHEIMNVLVFAGKVEERKRGDSRLEYTALELGDDFNALADLPCGVCPVFRDCHPGGLISPETCTYFNEWMQF
jgi:DNA-directed RNA polymerase III subunit RPC6